MEDKCFNSWLAGFFDGEGWITINNLNHIPNSLVIGIGNTNEYIIKLIRKWFKGNIRYRILKGISKNCWFFEAHNKNAVTFLETIYPYLFIKKEQAYIGLEYSKLIGKSGKRMSLENLKLRKNLLEQLHILNKMGKSDLELKNKFKTERTDLKEEK